jgi:hypothetical protein
MRVVVVPPRATPRVRTLLGTTGWEVEPGPRGELDPMAALLASGQGTPAVFVPVQTRVARRLHRIAVLHEGSPAASAGLEAADQAAVASASEVVMLHVAMLEPPAEPGSLCVPRVADHLPYEWEHWRGEFLRRFGRGSPGVPHRLEVLTGPAVEAIVAAARRLRPELMVATWKGVARPGRAELLKEVVRRAPCSVLMLLEPQAQQRPARRIRAAVLRRPQP